MTIRTAAALVALGLLGCGRPAPNVIIVLIDTLRVDRLGASEADASVTPFLDSLADRSFVFHEAYAASPWTSPSVASIFTSRYPSQHGIETWASVLGENERTLAEVFHAHGYATGGFSANSLIRENLGFAQGFDLFHVNHGVGKALERAYERTPETGARALAWIGDRPPGPTPVFVYLHIMDPHTPYAPTKAALDWAFEGQKPPRLSQVNAALAGRIEHPISGEMQTIAKRIYDAEVRSADAALAEFFSRLDARRIAANSIVVVVSDHGEELWDHGRLGHGNGLFDEVIREALLISLPGQSERCDISRAVSAVDLAPTLLDLAGIPVPEEFAGRSLAPHLRECGSRWRRLLRRVSDAGEPAPEPVVSELVQPQILRKRAHERAVMIGAYKLIVDADGERHYFDRSLDPEERGDIAVAAPARAELDQALAAFLERMPENVSADRLPVDAATREALEALGYAE